MPKLSPNPVYINPDCASKSSVLMLWLLLAGGGIFICSWSAITNASPQSVERPNRFAYIIFTFDLDALRCLFVAWRTEIAEEFSVIR